MGVHETHERIEHAEHAAHSSGNKRTALLIIILAVALALIEIGGKEAQFNSIEHNINASDAYAFYQAKTIRAEILRAVAAAADVLAGDPGERAAPRHDQVEKWAKEIERLDSDPKSGEGRKELLDRAKAIEANRDRESQSYHEFEMGSAALQLAIVIASAAVITEVTALETVSIILGIAGVVVALIGWWAPQLLPV